MLNSDTTMNSSLISNLEENLIIRHLDIPNDGKLLAELFNAFNTSWEGGFYGEGNNSKEGAIEFVQRLKKIDILVVEDTKLHKLVGYCSIHPHAQEQDACYVGILGVHQDYFNKKLGKRLMLESYSIAVSNHYQRLNLNTWPGNLKAMPLYKKLGLMWVPETSVSMESYIPLIISQDIFKNFWNDEFDWYSTFTREINQIPDRYKKDNLDVYEYKFVHNTDSLTIWIDRYAKMIQGFKLSSGTTELEISLNSQDNKAYKGLD